MPRVAIVGRPNVGKSTLFNRLVGEDRSVVHDLAGTTRDSIDTLVETDGGPIVFIDTAGMRRKGKIDDAGRVLLVRPSVAFDRRRRRGAAGDRCDRRCHRAGSAPRRARRFGWLPDRADPQQVGSRRHRGAPGGAGTGRPDAGIRGRQLGAQDLGAERQERRQAAPRLHEAISQYHTRVPTKDVNKIIAAAQQRQPAGGGAKILYAVQGAIDPPTFTLFVNREIPQHYLRYIERTIREEFGLGSTALKLRVRKRQ